MTTVITYGTYDLLHYGHIKLLERAKALGDKLIVGVTSDDFDRARGKINNQQTLMERISAVAKTGLADEIVVEEYEGQKIDDIKRLGVDIFTVGSDWVGKFDYLNDYCQVIYLPRTEGISSSSLRTEQRKLKLAIEGNFSFVEKIKKEAGFVNGVEVLKDHYEDSDAVYIATHPRRHYEDVKKALLANKHVLCEAPISIKKNECEELFEMAREKKLVLSTAIKTAFANAYYRMIVLAESGEIGDIVSVDATCTSLADNVYENLDKIDGMQNSICDWGPTALLPVFQLLGTNYKDKRIVTRLLDSEKKFDSFTKIDFIYDKAVASIKVGKGAKSEGELIITGTKGYIYVPSPWWKTDYFEARFENMEGTRKFFYRLDGEGIRNEIAAFSRAIIDERNINQIEGGISLKISEIISSFYDGEYITIG